MLADFVREYGAGIAGTATNATSTTLVDASNFGGARAGGLWPNGSPIRLTSGSRAGDNTTKSSAIDTVTVPGTITVSPAFGGTPSPTTPSFVISNEVEHFDRIIESINRALTRRCSRFLKVGLTNVPDGDFLGTTVSDHWAATTATGSYVTLSMANGVMQRVLKVVTTAANGYLQSDQIPVEPLETRNFQVFMRNAHTVATTSNVATLVLRDLTNGATITPNFQYGAATTSSHAFVTAQGSYSVPAGCSGVAWRLGSSTDMTADSNAGVQFGMLIDNSVNQRTFFTQPHLLTEDDFAALYQYSQGGTQISGPIDGAFIPKSRDGMSFSDMGYGLAIEFDANPGFPLFYDEYSFFPAFAQTAGAYSDTDTTDADEELVLCGAAIELYTMLSNRSTEKPVFSRGRLVPTTFQLKLQQAQERWDSPRVSRLRAPVRRSKTRTYRIGTYA